MATINGLTAEAMQAIRDGVIVDANVVDGNLILTRFDETEIDAGSVIGPTGSPGVTEGELEDALLLTCPIGSIIEYIETTAPTNWLAMAGQTIVNGQTLYPLLWAKLSASMKSGSSIIMPDTRKTMSVGYDASDSDFNAIGKTGGAKTVTLTDNEMPSHDHDMAHNHAEVDVMVLGTQAGVASGSGTTIYSVPYSGSTIAGNKYTVNIPVYNGNTGARGAGGSHNNMPPFITFLRIIRAL